MPIFRIPINSMPSMFNMGRAMRRISTAVVTCTETVAFFKRRDLASRLHTQKGLAIQKIDLLYQNSKATVLKAGTQFKLFLVLLALKR